MNKIHALSCDLKLHDWDRCSHRSYHYMMIHMTWDKFRVVTTLRRRQNRCRFAGEVFKFIFLKENCCISLKLCSEGPFNNKPSLVQIMAWCQTVVKPLSAQALHRLPIDASLGLKEVTNEMALKATDTRISTETFFVINYVMQYIPIVKSIRNSHISI